MTKKHTKRRDVHVIRAGTRREDYAQWKTMVNGSLETIVPIQDVGTTTLNLRGDSIRVATPPRGNGDDDGFGDDVGRVGRHEGGGVGGPSGCYEKASIWKFPLSNSKDQGCQLIDEICFRSSNNFLTFVCPHLDILDSWAFEKRRIQLPDCNCRFSLNN